jgi:hypothetical protein
MKISVGGKKKISPKFGKSFLAQNAPKAHGIGEEGECETRHKFMSRQKNKKIVYRLMIKIFPRNK